jgi:hypothetical protein
MPLSIVSRPSWSGWLVVSSRRASAHRTAAQGSGIGASASRRRGSPRDGDRPNVLSIHHGTLSPPMPRSRRSGAVYLGEEVPPRLLAPTCWLSAGDHPCLWQGCVLKDDPRAVGTVTLSSSDLLMTVVVVIFNRCTALLREDLSGVTGGCHPSEPSRALWLRLGCWPPCSSPVPASLATTRNDLRCAWRT